MDALNKLQAIVAKYEKRLDDQRKATAALREINKNDPEWRTKKKAYMTEYCKERHKAKYEERNAQLLTEGKELPKRGRPKKVRIPE
jgi:hypothetical protein